MAHIVAEPCFDCKYTDCVVVCPVDCFYEGAQMLYIHPDECIDCEACVPECPVEAIFHEDNLPDEWKEFTAAQRRDAISASCPMINEKKDALEGGVVRHEPEEEVTSASPAPTSRLGAPPGRPRRTPANRPGFSFVCVGTCASDLQFRGKLVRIRRRPGSRGGTETGEETGPWWAFHPAAGSGSSGRCSPAGRSASKTDAELLEHFASGEAAESAFEALVVRHGPEVLRACRRVLPDPNDAEDAFQATFLVLARCAASGSIGRPDSLGPWLHGVALRVARKARVAAARRRWHEQRVAGRPEAGFRPEERPRGDTPRRGRAAAGAATDPGCPLLPRGHDLPGCRLPARTSPRARSGAGWSRHAASCGYASAGTKESPHPRARASRSHVAAGPMPSRRPPRRSAPRRRSPRAGRASRASRRPSPNSWKESVRMMIVTLG